MIPKYFFGYLLLLILTLRQLGCWGQWKIVSYLVWTSSLLWASFSGIWTKLFQGPWWLPAVYCQCWKLLLFHRSSIQFCVAELSIRDGAVSWCSEESRSLTSVERRTGVWDGGPNKQGGKLVINPAAGLPENLGWNPGSASWVMCHFRHVEFTHIHNFQSNHHKLPTRFNKINIINSGG